MNSFAAIDFETANEQRTSICSVGLVVVREGVIVDRFYSLIQPEPNYYSYWNMRVHGITQEDTEKAPLFPFVWEEVGKRTEGLPFVAHNRSFDENCLKAAFKTYCMDYPGYEFYCTLQASRKAFRHLSDHKLRTVASCCGFDLQNHHHALADAEACARIALTVFL